MKKKTKNLIRYNEHLKLLLCISMVRNTDCFCRQIDYWAHGRCNRNEGAFHRKAMKEKEKEDGGEEDEESGKKIMRQNMQMHTMVFILL